MTETEKMQAGLLYDANYNAQLLQARIRCKELCYDFNRLRPAQEAEQQALMRRWAGPASVFPSSRRSGATMAAISKLARIFSPTITA